MLTGCDLLKSIPQTGNWRLLDGIVHTKAMTDLMSSFETHAKKGTVKLFFFKSRLEVENDFK